MEKNPIVSECNSLLILLNDTLHKFWGKSRKHISESDLNRAIGDPGIIAHNTIILRSYKLVNGSEWHYARSLALGIYPAIRHFIKGLYKNDIDGCSAPFVSRVVNGAISIFYYVLLFTKSNH